MPLAAALKARGARLGTLTAFIMISPILSPETIVLTAALLGAKFTIARIVFPVLVTFLMGLALQYSASTANQAISIAAGNPAASDLEAGCCADDEPLERQAHVLAQLYGVVASALDLLRARLARGGNTAGDRAAVETSRATCTAASEPIYSRPSPGFPYTSAREPKCLSPMACSKPAWELVRRSLSCSAPSAPASPRS